MAAAVKVATFPFRALWLLIKLLVLPVLVGSVALWLGFSVSSWAFWVTVLAAVWSWVLVRLWWAKTSGELRSLSRGTVDVRTSGRRSRGGRR